MRPASSVTRFALRVIALAVAVLVLRLPTARFAPEVRDPARIAAVSHAPKAEVATSGGRVLARIAPAPLASKLPVAPLAVSALPRGADGGIAEYEGSLPTQSVWGSAVLRVLRRIPRMDSGDPPRV